MTTPPTQPQNLRGKTKQPACVGDLFQRALSIVNAPALKGRSRNPEAHSNTKQDLWHGLEGKDREVRRLKEEVRHLTDRARKAEKELTEAKGKHTALIADSKKEKGDWYSDLKRVEGERKVASAELVQAEKESARDKAAIDSLCQQILDLQNEVSRHEDREKRIKRALFDADDDRQTKRPKTIAEIKDSLYPRATSVESIEFVQETRPLQTSTQTLRFTG